MEPNRYVEHLRAEGDALVAAAVRDLDAPVPSCPEWRNADLVDHMARLFTWWVACLREGRRVRGSELPPRGDDRVADYRSGLDEVVAVLSAADPDAPAWTFAGDGTMRFWHRRCAQEAAVHRWDAESSVGEAAPIERELAVDGIDELFEVQLAMLAPTGGGETLHFHATDGDGEWLLRLTPDGPEVTREHAKGDVAVRATASDLLLLLWNRRSSDDLEVFGDASLLARWRDLRF